MEKRTNDPSNAFANRHLRSVLLAEKVALGLLIAGVVLCHLGNSYCNLFLMVGGVAGLIIYLLLAYRPALEKDMVPVDIDKPVPLLFSPAIMHFIKKLAGFALALGCMALMGLTEYFEASVVLVASAVLLVPVFIIAVITKLRSQNDPYNFSFFTRVVIMIVLLSYLAAIRTGL